MGILERSLQRVDSGVDVSGDEPFQLNSGQLDGALQAGEPELAGGHFAEGFFGPADLGSKGGGVVAVLGVLRIEECEPSLVVRPHERADIVDDPAIDVLATEGVASGRLPGHREVLFGASEHGGVHRPAAKVVDGDALADRRGHGKTGRRRHRLGHEGGDAHARLLDGLAKDVQTGGAPVGGMGDTNGRRYRFALLATGLAVHAAQDCGYEVDNGDELVAEKDLSFADRPLRRRLEALGVEDGLMERSRPDKKLLVLGEEHRRRHP